MNALSKDERDLLDHMEFTNSAGLYVSPEGQSLIDKGLLAAELVPGFKGCFTCEIYITRRGIAVSRGLH